MSVKQMIEKRGYVYILTNAGNTVLYTGVTGNLIKRVYEHKNKMIDGFPKKYNLHKLVYYEAFLNEQDAKEREKLPKEFLKLSFSFPV